MKTFVLTVEDSEIPLRQGIVLRKAYRLRRDIRGERDHWKVYLEVTPGGLIWDPIEIGDAETTADHLVPDGDDLAGRLFLESGSTSSQK